MFPSDCQKVKKMGGLLVKEYSDGIAHLDALLPGME